MPNGEYLMSQFERLRRMIVEKIHHEPGTHIYNYVRLSQLLADAIQITEDIVSDKTDDLTVAASKQIADDEMINMEVNKSFIVPMMIYRQKLLQKKISNINLEDVTDDN